MVRTRPHIWTQPFTLGILIAPLTEHFRHPKFYAYDGLSDPTICHAISRADDATLCHAFILTLTGAPATWYTTLKGKQFNTFEELSLAL